MKNVPTNLTAKSIQEDLKILMSLVWAGGASNPAQLRIMQLKLQNISAYLKAQEQSVSVTALQAEILELKKELSKTKAKVTRLNKKLGIENASN